MIGSPAPDGIGRLAYDWDGTCGEWACLPGGDGGVMVCTDIRNAG